MTTEPRNNLTGTWPYIAIVIAYSVLVLWTSVHIPLFEAPDAYYHYAAIDHIAETRTLPPGEEAAYRPYGWAAFHGPLYYLAAAGLITILDPVTAAGPDFPDAYPRNPHAQTGEPHAQANRNFVAHAHATGARVWIARALSMVCGLLTVAGVMTITRLLAPRSAVPALIAGSIVAFNPQFLFIHAVVSNDTLVTTLATWVLVMLVWIIRRGLTTRRVLMLATLLALASLAKASGLTLYPITIIAALWVCWRDRVPRRRVLMYAALGLGVWLIVAGWWYFDNWRSYGDPTASGEIVTLAGRGEADVVVLGEELVGAYYSFWGLFGWFNVSPPDGFYALPLLLIGASAAGGILLASRRRSPVDAMQASPNRHDGYIIILLGVSFVLVFAASWLRFHLQVNVAQGRLFFPLLGVLAPTLALGLAALPRLLSSGLMGVWLIAAIIMPIAVIAPAYAAPDPLAGWSPPDDAVAFTIREPWSEQACLTVWTRPPHITSDSATVDLWWRVDCEFTGYWSVFMHWIDLERESCQAGDTSHILAQRDTMPAGGNLPFPAMEPGRVYADQLRTTPPESASAPETRDFHLGLYDAGGTFIRAFVTPQDASEIGGPIRVGQCGPETILYTTQAAD